MRVVHVDEAVAVEYLNAKAARGEVCRQDCHWPIGDGECGYCVRERKALAALEAALSGGGSGG